MNKVITINLGGTAWQLEEGGYDTLRLYLETAGTRLQGNPDRDEIISDIEWAIAEKFRVLLSNHKTVVLNQEVATVLAEMGPIDAEPGKAATPGPIGPGSAGGPGASGASGAAGTAGAAQAQTGAGPTGTPKRLYRLPEGAMLAGVCNGIASYVNIDPTLVRLAFVLLLFVWGAGVVAYIVMAIVIPEARTSEEKAAATGNPSTAQEFIRRAREGYYEALKGFPDRQARREWQRRFRRQMRLHTDQWCFNWRSYWAQRAPIPPGLGYALPFISLMNAALTVVWLCALVSLLANGTIFGWALPANVPVWIAAAVLLFLYGILAGPLKLARRACYWGMGQSQPRTAWSLMFFMDASIGVAMAIVLCALAYHNYPELSAAVKSLPPLVHQATSDFQTWWRTK